MDRLAIADKELANDDHKHEDVDPRIPRHPGSLLGHEWNGSRRGERAGELREDRQVRMELDPLKPTDAERE